MILFRPVGLEELRLIYEAGMKQFPARRPDQPIFYPVLDASYAAQIARDWHTRSRPFAGYVTQFELDSAHGLTLDKRQVAGSEHVEFWVPAAQLAAFNAHLVGPIRVTDAHFRSEFERLRLTGHGFEGRTPVEAFLELELLLGSEISRFSELIREFHLAVFLCYPFWADYDFGLSGVSTDRRQHVLGALRECWRMSFGELELPQVS